MFPYPKPPAFWTWNDSPSVRLFTTEKMVRRVSSVFAIGQKTSSEPCHSGRQSESTSLSPWWVVCGSDGYRCANLSQPELAPSRHADTLTYILAGALLAPDDTRDKSHQAYACFFSVIRLKTPRTFFASKRQALRSQTGRPEEARSENDHIVVSSNGWGCVGTKNANMQGVSQRGGYGSTIGPKVPQSTQARKGQGTTPR
jgi:hypothetical protein